VAAVVVVVVVVVVEYAVGVEVGSHSTGAWTTSITAMGAEATTTTRMHSTNIAMFNIRSL